MLLAGLSLAVFMQESADKLAVECCLGLFGQSLFPLSFLSGLCTGFGELTDDLSKGFFMNNRRKRKKQLIDLMLKAPKESRRLCAEWRRARK